MIKKTGKEIAIMKKNIAIAAVTAALIISPAVSKAQPKAGTFSIIPRLGVTLAKITGDDIYMPDENTIGNFASPKYKPGLMAGADIEYQATNTLAVSLGAYYSRQGEKYDDVTESHDNSTKAWTEVSDWKQHHDYVNIPLMISAYVAPNFAVKAGVQMGFNTSARMEYTTASFTRNDAGIASTESVKKTKTDVKVKKTDFSIPVGISYEYMNVILDARYNIGLTKVYDNIDGRNSVLTFNVGYRFAL